MTNTKFLQLREGTLAYDDSGNGPLVVCIPGMGDLRGQFRFLAEQLVSAGFRVVTMDLRGHGESSANWPDYSLKAITRDIIDLLKALDAGPAVLIGNSYGAGAALRAAHEAPQLVARVVLISPFLRGVELTGSQRLLYSAMFARPWGPAAWLYYYNTLYPTRKPADFAQYTARLKANLRQRGRLESLKQMMVPPQVEPGPRYWKVEAPVLTIFGSKDPDYKDPRDEARFAQEALGSQTLLVEGAGHYPHTEMLEVVWPQILAFIESELAERQEEQHGVQNQVG